MSQNHSKEFFKMMSEWVKVTQSCSALCDPMDYTVNEILQDRILEWVVFPLSSGIFPTQGSNPGLPPTLQGDCLPAEPQGKPLKRGMVMK